MVQSSKDGDEHPLDRQYRSLQCQVQPLESGSNEYKVGRGLSARTLEIYLSSQHDSQIRKPKVWYDHIYVICLFLVSQIVSKASNHPQATSTNVEPFLKTCIYIYNVNFKPSDREGRQTDSGLDRPERNWLLAMNLNKPVYDSSGQKHIQIKYMLNEWMKLELQ